MPFGKPYYLIYIYIYIGVDLVMAGDHSKNINTKKQADCINVG